jgi:hypothetical protein
MPKRGQPQFRGASSLAAAFDSDSTTAVQEDTPVFTDPGVGRRPVVAGTVQFDETDD